MRELFIDAIILGAIAGLLTPFIVHRLRKAVLQSRTAPRDRAESVRRVLKHVQRRPIADLQDGTAAVIVGTVKAIPGVAMLRSPASNTECLGFHLDVRGRELDPTLRFPQLHDSARIVEIEVTDSTGTIRVSAEGLELAITNAAVQLWDPPLSLALEELVGGPKRVTVEEGLLLPGAQILVCGVAVREVGVAGYRDGASTLVLRATPTFPLVASTDPDLFVAGAHPVGAEELYRRAASAG